MSLSHIPTPETDALLVKNAQSDTTGLEDYEILAEFACELERRLTVARTALAKINNSCMNMGQVEDVADEALNLTAPKP